MQDAVEFLIVVMGIVGVFTVIVAVMEVPIRKILIPLMVCITIAIHYTIGFVESCNWDCQQAELKANEPEFRAADFVEIMPKALKE